jgi:PAS domain-containing protein
MNLFSEAYNRKMRLFKDLRTAFLQLKEVKHEPAFRAYRERYVELIFVVLSAFALIDVLIGIIYDLVVEEPQFETLLWIRIGFYAFLAANFSMYLFFGKKVNARWFVYPLFVLYTIYSPIIASMTTGIASPDWFEIIFILVVWFMLIPFGYKELGLFALFLAVLYTFLLYPLTDIPVQGILFLEYGFNYITVFLFGLLVAIFNNIFSASVYLNETRIAKSEERFRMFTQNSLDVVWTMDAQTGLITYVSPSVYNLRGYQPDELIGLPMEESLTPASRENLDKLIAKARAKSATRPELRADGQRKSQMHADQNAQHEQVVIGELEQLTKSGESVWVEVIVSFVTNEQGEIIEVVGDSRNITERKKAEQELIRMQQLLEEKSNKLQEENIRIQYESLKTQINPHFLFNSLNVLTSLIRLDPKLAEQFTEQMSKVYRYVLEHKEEDVVSLRTEMDFIHSYIFLLDIRFEGKIQFEINLPDAFMDKQIAPLTIQLLIENAVKHNVFSKLHPMVVELFIDEDGFFTVRNTLRKRKVHMGTTGVGLHNIRERYQQITDKEPVFTETEDYFIARIPVIDR